MTTYGDIIVGQNCFAYKGMLPEGTNPFVESMLNYRYGVLCHSQEINFAARAQDTSP